MLQLRSLQMWVVGLSLAIAVGLSPLFQPPARSVPPGSELAQVATAQTRSPTLPATVRDPLTYGTGLQRTLYLLASSTPTRRNTVRILFYCLEYRVG